MQKLTILCSSGGGDRVFERSSLPESSTVMFRDCRSESEVRIML